VRGVENRHAGSDYRLKAQARGWTTPPASGDVSTGWRGLEAPQRL